MKRSAKILFLCGLITLISLKGFSQLSISYYSASLSKIGIGYNLDDKVWGEFRLYGNRSIDDIGPELVFCYNIVKKENHNIYLGLGAAVNYFNGLVIPVGVQFTPIAQFDKFSLHIEIEPVIDFDNDLFILTSWGLRYSFGAKS